MAAALVAIPAGEAPAQAMHPRFATTDCGVPLRQPLVEGEPVFGLRLRLRFDEQREMKARRMK